MHIIAIQWRKNSQAAMYWSNLNYFLTFARSGSLSAASRVLGTDHSTVARRIETLEKELKLRLVDRRARAYSLTAAGQQVRDLALRVETAIGDIERFAQGTAGLPQGLVRVSGPSGVITHFIAPRLVKLQRQYRGLQVELIGESQEASLNRREADIALRMSRPHENGLVARKLGEITYGLYGLRDYLGDCPPENWDFLGFDESRDQYPQQQWLKTITGARELTLRASDYTVLIAAVRAGLGVAVLPQGLVRYDKSLKQLTTPTPAPSRDLWLVFHSDVGKAPAIRAVIDHLTAIFKNEWARVGRDNPGVCLLDQRD
jgi:DNA-binding transcriptional LysR family regulator